MRSTVYTIGHSNISEDAFFKLLLDAVIEVIVDVRSLPYSQYAPQFNRENLKKTSAFRGIEYLYMGDTLGGKPKNRDCYVNGKPDYDTIRQKDSYKEGLDRLIKIIAKYPLAIMCSEENPMKCHRRNLIGIDLYDRGIRVIHIRGNGNMEEDAFADNKSLQASLFR